MSDKAEALLSLYQKGLRQGHPVMTAIKCRFSEVKRSKACASIACNNEEAPKTCPCSLYEEMERSKVSP